MITVEQTVAWLEQAVAERGADFNYIRHYSENHDSRDRGLDCLYVERNPETGEKEPGCIAGLVFTYAGVRLGELRRWEGNRAQTVAGVFDFDTKAGSLLADVQSHQDDGESWGEAVQTAKERRGL